MVTSASSGVRFPSRRPSWPHLALLLVLLTALSACRNRRPGAPILGNADRGRDLILLHECYDCHIIPGIDRKPGPGVVMSLEGFAGRSTFARGTLETTQANVERYIQKPRTLYPPATMPGIGDRPAEARDIAAYVMALD